MGMPGLRSAGGARFRGRVAGRGRPCAGCPDRRRRARGRDHPGDRGDVRRWNWTKRVQVERVVADLVERTGVRGSLLLLHGPVTWAAWLGFPGPGERGGDGRDHPGPRRRRDRSWPSAARRRDGGSAPHTRPGTGGPPSPPLPGIPRPAVVSDVRLERLLSEDEAAAHRFVADELDDLVAAEERADRTGDILLVWLTHRLAGARRVPSGVHENTVRLRIRYAEQVMPHGLAERRTEVLTALRLRQMLGPQATRACGLRSARRTSRRRRRTPNRSRTGSGPRRGTRPAARRRRPVRCGPASRR